MQFYTLTLVALGADKPRYTEEIDAPSDELAVLIAQDSVTALTGILEWTAATLTNDAGALVWQKMGLKA